jgi:hypothetical protein
VKLCILLIFLVWVLLIAAMLGYAVIKIVRFLDQKEREDD